MEQEYTFNDFKLEDMTGYFASVRKKFIEDCPSLWYDNLFVNAILVRAYQINKAL